jgi:hypothetical protein
VLGTRDVLIAQEQYPMFQQRCADFGEQRIVVNGIGEIHADQFRADRARQLFNLHDGFLR